MEHVYTIETGNVDREDEVLCSVWRNLDGALAAASDTASTIAEEISNDYPNQYTVQKTNPSDNEFLFSIIWNAEDGSKSHATDWWRVRKIEVKENLVRPSFHEHRFGLS